MNSDLSFWEVVVACLPVGFVVCGAGGWLLWDWFREGQRMQRAARFAVKHYRPEDHPEHRLPTKGEPVSVAELLERNLRDGHGVRLRWTDADTDTRGLAADRDDDWPTVVLPQVTDDSAMEDAALVDDLPPLPRRPIRTGADALPPPPAPPDKATQFRDDPEVLARVLDGLRDWRS